MSHSITVSDRAASRIEKILAKEAPGAMLRVGVAGGGCSGFQYTFDIVTDSYARGHQPSKRAM